MNRQSVAYLINTTPKYFFMLPLHITLLRRYAPNVTWPVYIATEEPSHPIIRHIQEKWSDIGIIPLTQDQEGFLESRLAATNALPSYIEYVFPIQEDFLLEGRPIDSVLESAVRILDEFPSVSSMRLMPCPGPKGDQCFGKGPWRILEFGKDPYIFTYQATLWRRESYADFLKTLLQDIDEAFGTPLTPSQKVEIQIRMNVAETEFGYRALKVSTALHLAYPREGGHPNAVYLAPWPYRPTAIVRGVVQGWAEDLAIREGMPLRPSDR